MSIDRHSNLVKSLVATAPSPASSGTSLVVTAADGALFPSPPFNVTIFPSGASPTLSNAEIVRVTAISTDTFTIVRAQEGTNARTVVVGDNIRLTITNKSLIDIELPPLMITHNFQNDSRLDSLTYGSGSFSTNGNGAVLECASGSAGAARAGVVTADTMFHGSPRFAATVRPTLMDTAHANEMYCGMGNVTVNQTTGHSWVFTHIGFKFVVESGTWKLRATQADGSTETQSSVLDSSISPYDWFYFKIMKYDTSSVDYYWAKNDADLQVVTLTTNIPTADRNEFQVSISSVNSSDQVGMNATQATFIRG